MITGSANYSGTNRIVPPMRALCVAGVSMSPICVTAVSVVVDVVC